MTEDNRFRIPCSWNVVYCTNLMECVEGKRIHGKLFMGQCVPSQSNSSPPPCVPPPRDPQEGQGGGREEEFVYHITPAESAPHVENIHFSSQFGVRVGHALKIHTHTFLKTEIGKKNKCSAKKKRHNILRF
jgi:hypothetical protein